VAEFFLQHVSAKMTTNERTTKNLRKLVENGVAMFFLEYQPKNQSWKNNVAAFSFCNTSPQKCNHMKGQR